MSWGVAWKRYATPQERAIAAATRRIPDEVVAEVLAAAKRDGYLVTMTPPKRKRRRGR